MLKIVISVSEKDPSAILLLLCYVNLQPFVDTLAL